MLCMDFLINIHLLPFSLCFTSVGLFWKSQAALSITVDLMPARIMHKHIMALILSNFFVSENDSIGGTKRHILKEINSFMIDNYMY